MSRRIFSHGSSSSLALMKVIASLLALGLFVCMIATVNVTAAEPQDAAQVRQQREQFTAWMRDHDRVYSNDEFHERYTTWSSNADFIASHNAREDSQFEVGMNEFGDMTSSEFATYYKGFTFQAAPEEDNSVASATEEGSEGRGKGFLPELDDDANTNTNATKRSLPATWDWRSNNGVTSVKNQGSCGCCYTFAAAGAIESLRMIKSGATLDLSEQQLVDCSGNAGCNGGNMNTVYSYIVNNRGVTSESSYPYQAKQGTCRASGMAAATTIAGYVGVARGSESALQSQVYAAPVSVGIDASHSSFQFYKSGVYYEPACSPTSLDHAVLAVGWGSNYWILKNQWGTSWGQSGYMFLARNMNNHCGVATMASAPTI